MSETSPVRPVAFTSKADAVYTELRQRILDGEIRPSSSLNQEQLATMLGVSTTPLREALRRLEAEGFVRTVAHREMVVAPIEIEELVALYEVRRNLDPLAAGLAAERYGVDDRARMVAALEALRADSIDESRTSLNREFHAAIYHSCQNLVLIELLDQLWDRADRYRRLIGRLSGDLNTYLEHEKLLQSVLDRDPDEATRLMRDHLLKSGTLIEEQLRVGESESNSLV